MNRTRVGILAAVIVAVACSGDSTAPPPPIPGHLYVADYGNHQILVFATPLNAASVASITISTDTTKRPQGIAVDTLGNVVACSFGSDWLTAYQAPLTTGSNPVDSVHYGSLCELIAFGPDGRLYVPDEGSNTVYEYTPPVSSSSVPVGVAPDVAQPLGVAFDSSARLYVGESRAGIQVYAPPYALAPLFTVDTFLPPVFALALDAAGRLYAAPFDGSVPRNRIYAYDPPLSAASTVGDSIVQGLTNVKGIAIGPDGRLYVADSAAILVYDPPLSHRSRPAVTVPLPGGAAALGIAVGR